MIKLTKYWCSLVAVLGCLTASAEDSYLYWMVDVGDALVYAQGRGAQISSVQLKYFNDTGDSGYLNLLAQNGASLGESVAWGADTTTPNSVLQYNEIGGGSTDPGDVSVCGFWASLSSQTGWKNGYSFVVELFNDSTWVGQSAELSYNDAVTEGLISFGKMTPPPIPWAAATFAVPEPNSALLMLLGCAVLALRRRRSGGSDSFSASEGGCET